MVEGIDIEEEEGSDSLTLPIGERVEVLKLGIDVDCSKGFRSSVGSRVISEDDSTEEGSELGESVDCTNAKSTGKVVGEFWILDVSATGIE